MCECNCLLSGEFFKLRAPNIGREKRWYIIQKYPGCKNCSTPCSVMFFEISEYNPEFHIYKDCLYVTIAKTDVMTFFSQEELQTQLKEYLTSYLLDNNFFEKPFDKFDVNAASEEFAQQFMDNMNNVKYKLKGMKND